MLLEVFHLQAMVREEVAQRMVDEETRNQIEINPQGRLSTGIIIRMVECEVNNYAVVVAVVVDTT